MHAHGYHSSWDAVDPGRTRVLLECPKSSSPTLIADAIERHGYEVKICEGPDHRHDCPLVTEGVCTLVNGADVVVNMLNGPDPEQREVLSSITAERRPPAVVAELTEPEIERRAREEDWPFDRDRVRLLSSPLTVESLISAIEDAAGDRRP